MDSLQSVIVQDVVLMEDLASFQAWIDGYGQGSSLTEIADKLKDAQALVSGYACDGLEVAENQSSSRSQLISAYCCPMASTFPVFFGSDRPL